MGIGYEISHVEGIKEAVVWNRDNIKMNLQKIGLRSRNVAQGRKDGDLIKMFWWIFGCFTIRRITRIDGKLLAFMKYLLHGFGWLVSERCVLKKEQEVTHSFGNEVPVSS